MVLEFMVSNIEEILFFSQEDSSYKYVAVKRFKKSKFPIILSSWVYVFKSI